MRNLINPAITQLALFGYMDIEYWHSNPIEAQLAVLQHLITSAQYTEFGRKYDFSNTFSIKTFKENVPISEYEDFKPYIEQVLSGEENVLWNTPIEWFAKSSGTTNDKSKFIPLSKECIEDCHFKAAKDVLSLYHNFNINTQILTGKGLVIGGSHQLNPLNEKIQYGDLSAVLLENSPFWSNWIRTPELSIALLNDWDIKIDKLAQNTIHEPVSSIAGVPTWSIVLIKKILELTQKKQLVDVWPQFELFIHGGVSFEPYRNQCKQLLGENVHFLEIYNASEGFFAAQDNLNEEGMVLFLDHGIFYEFLPLEDYGKINPKTIGLNKVELNKNYVLIISTNTGLWRYIIGDTIMFTKLYPFKIKVTGRTKQFINAFGEELMVFNSDKAIELTCKATDSIIKDYTAAPIYFSENKNGSHEWLIEFEKSPESLHKFTEILDKNLQSLNSDYEAKRKHNIALSLPIIHAVKPDTFYNWLKQQNKLGGQHKIPRLSNNRYFIESIKESMD